MNFDRINRRLEALQKQINALPEGFSRIDGKLCYTPKLLEPEPAKPAAKEPEAEDRAYAPFNLQVGDFVTKRGWKNSYEVIGITCNGVHLTNGSFIFFHNCIFVTRPSKK